MFSYSCRHFLDVQLCLRWLEIMHKQPVILGGLSLFSVRGWRTMPISLEYLINQLIIQMIWNKIVFVFWKWKRKPERRSLLICTSFCKLFTNDQHFFILSLIIDNRLINPFFLVAQITFLKGTIPSTFACFSSQSCEIYRSIYWDEMGKFWTYRED